MTIYPSPALVTSIRRVLPEDLSGTAAELLAHDIAVSVAEHIAVQLDVVGHARGCVCRQCGPHCDPDHERRACSCPIRGLRDALYVAVDQ